MFKNTLIVGCGLIGSSILRASLNKKASKNFFVYEKSKKSYLPRGGVPRSEEASDVLTVALNWAAAAAAAAAAAIGRRNERLD